MNEHDTHSRIPDPDVALEGGVDTYAGQWVSQGELVGVL